MSRHRKRKPERQTSLSPEERERRRKEAEGWRRRAGKERGEGLSDDAGGRWLAAQDAGRDYQRGTDWRTKPTTVRQQAILRECGLNPLLYRTRGAASDAITHAGRGA